MAVLLTLLVGVSCHATSLQKADSLFASQRFTDARTMYSHAFFDEKKTSPAALLKMAFMEEGLQKPDLTIFFLHQYYLFRPDSRVKNRIEDLSSQNKFSGYSIDEADYGYFLYRVYGQRVEIGLFAIACFIFFFMIFRKFKKVTLGYTPIFILFFLISAGYLLNFRLPYKRAVLHGDKIFLMSGPSSGSSVLDVLGNGHRVEWVGSNDIWFEIKWNEKRGWVKKSDLLFFM